jgi:hypothetical protein
MSGDVIYTLIITKAIGKAAYTPQGSTGLTGINGPITLDTSDTPLDPPGSLDPVSDDGGIPVPPSGGGDELNADIDGSLLGTWKDKPAMEGYGTPGELLTVTFTDTLNLYTPILHSVDSRTRVIPTPLTAAGNLSWERQATPLPL